MGWQGPALRGPGYPTQTSAAGSVLCDGQLAARSTLSPDGCVLWWALTPVGHGSSWQKGAGALRPGRWLSQPDFRALATSARPVQHRQSLPGGLIPVPSVICKAHCLCCVVCTYAPGAVYRCYGPALVRQRTGGDHCLGACYCAVL